MGIVSPTAPWIGCDLAIAVALAIAVGATARITSRRWKAFWLLPFVIYGLAALLRTVVIHWRPASLDIWTAALDVAILAALYIAIVGSADPPRSINQVRIAAAVPLLVAATGVFVLSARPFAMLSVTVQIAFAAAAARELFRKPVQTRGRTVLAAATVLFPLAAVAALSPVVSAAPALRCIALLLAGTGAISTVVEERIVSLAAEVENLLARQHQLAQLAEVDPLTGCANRHALRTWLDRWDERSPITIMVLDVDNLKRINDRHGHAAGDIALQLVAGVLREAVRADDLVVRWGGDEFVAILTATGENTAMNRFGHLVRLLTHAADNFAYDEPLRASWGVASCNSRDEAAESLHEADRRMYAMKRQRRREG